MSRAFHHSIRANKGVRDQHNVIYFDVESLYPKDVIGTQVFTPFLWSACFKRYQNAPRKNVVEWQWGTEIEQFWDWVESKTGPKTTLYLTSYHLEPDFVPLQGRKNLLARGWGLKLFIQNGRTVILIWQKDDRKIYVYNAGNHFYSSLEDWGRKFGVPKLPMPADDAPIADWEKYCHRDVGILVLMNEYLNDFRRRHDLGNWKPSLAGMAWTAYRHRFMPVQIAIHRDTEAMVLEHDAFRGGRCEGLQLGDWTDDEYHNLDINSAYGHIEMTCELPYELRNVIDNPDLPWLAHLLDSYAVIADVELNTDEPVYMCKTEPKCTFPVGIFRTTLATPELEYALAHNHIVRIHKLAYYKQYPLFQAFATYFSEIKRQAELEENQVEREIAKRFINSVYGKTGQRGHEKSVIGKCEPGLCHYVPTFNGVTGHSGTIWYANSEISQTWDHGYARHSFPAIAAHVAAYARMMLWQYMKIAGLEHVYAVATDSLKVDSEGYQRLSKHIDPLRPGKLKDEGMSTNLVIRGPNDLTFGNEVKIKGVGPKGVQVDVNDYLVTQWPSLKRFFQPGVDEIYFTTVIKKHCARHEYRMLTDPEYAQQQVELAEARGNRHKEQALNPQVYELAMQIEAYQESRIVPATTVFALWNYQADTWRNAKDYHGNLVPVELSKYDSLATELGFKDVDELKAGVIRQLSIDRKINDLKYQLEISSSPSLA